MSGELYGIVEAIGGTPLVRLNEVVLLPVVWVEKYR